MTIQKAQEYVKKFAKDRNWEDYPNIDKFDHLHEELLEMSQYLRYKTREQREEYVKTHKNLFEKEIGDLMFGTLRIANQLGVDAEKGFEKAKQKLERKFQKGSADDNIIHHKSGKTQFGSPE